MHWFMTYAEYAEKLLNLDVLPTSMGMRTPLPFVLNLVSRSQRTSGAVFFAAKADNTCWQTASIRHRSSYTERAQNGLIANAR